MLLYLAEVNRVFDLKLQEYNNFEAGEGKTVLDTHFAHISHKLIRWVRVGNDLDTGEQLAELLQVHMLFLGKSILCQHYGPLLYVWPNIHCYEYLINFVK